MTPGRIISALLEGSVFDPEDSTWKQELRSFSPEYSSAAAYLEIYDAELLSVTDELTRTQGKGRISWEVVPVAKLKRIWLDFGRSGVIRDEKGLDWIGDRIVHLIARLEVCTQMAGHDTIDMRKVLSDDWDIEYSDEVWNDGLDDWLCDERGSWRISDYAFKWLHPLAFKILGAGSDQEKLYAIDRVLDVAHQRSDLASWFVEGGTDTLVHILDQV